jgi:hypothetical protein
MAKKLIKLSVADIILQADAETIRQALESRSKIDELLEKREAAYRQIEEIELQVEALVGEERAFVYPAPPMPVAGFNKPAPAVRPAPPAPPTPPTSDLNEESALDAEKVEEKESTDEK